MENLVWPITGILLLIIFKAFFDQNRIEDHKKINHPLEWAIVALFCYPSIIGFVVEVQIDWYYVLLPVAGMCAFFFWLAFDGFLNKLLGHSFWFTGSEDGKDDAVTDNILQGLKLWQHISLKIGGLVLFTTIYIIMYVIK